MRVIAGSQQQRFSYRVVATRAPEDAGKRVLVVAAEDYTGLSPNKPPYDSAPRYLDEHVDALEANGYAVEVYDVDAPPEGPDGQAGAKLLSDLGVLSHFDAVLYHSGDDLLPQATGEGVTDENYRRGGTVSPTGTFSLTGSQHLTNAGVRNAQMLRNYMNEGGKVVFTGCNPWLQQTSTSNGLNTYSDYSWWQEPVYGTTTFNSSAVQIGTDGFMYGMPGIVLDTSPGAAGTLEPTQDAATGAPDPRAKAHGYAKYAVRCVGVDSCQHGGHAQFALSTDRASCG